MIPGGEQLLCDGAFIALSILAGYGLAKFDRDATRAAGWREGFNVGYDDGMATNPKLTAAFALGRARGYEDGYDDAELDVKAGEVGRMLRAYAESKRLGGLGPPQKSYDPATGGVY